MMANDDVGTMLSRIRLTEDEVGIHPLHEVWKHEDAKVDNLRKGDSLGKVQGLDEGYSKAIRVKIDLEVEKPLEQFKSSQITATESKKV
ncbi:hypothetical protein SLEP1_g20272 [Rubroshorea leprosula]|uniref:Uncharacterized protein n=1 Tax=Rubroshorea leprosula TaxID=152421 RepID=A0AAV5JCS8_9ROSI|nr:hypothetical protein SLEP1_g20272 [Rubroshorea leprosula]